MCKALTIFRPLLIQVDIKLEIKDEIHDIKTYGLNLTVSSCDHESVQKMGYVYFM